MIPRLNQSSLSFQANKAVSPREAYDSHMGKIKQTAVNQSTTAANLAQNQININPIPMQGTGQKLDVIA